METIKDKYERSIDYIRISLTEVCNMKCIYCRPEGYEAECLDYLKKEDLIFFIENISRLGVKKIKLTGGEPLLREDFLAIFQAINEVETVEEITLTTNALLLEDFLPYFQNTKLKSINISLDTLDSKKFKKITGVDQLETVLSAIEASLASGIKTKVNTVLIKGINDNEILKFIELAKDQALDVRFIEMMPLGLGNDYEVLSSQYVFDLLQASQLELLALGKLGNGPAHYFQVDGFEGRIGLIDAISHNFCHECNRVRLSVDGFLQLCLAEGKMIDIKPWLTDGELIQKNFKKAVMAKPKQHQFEHKKYQQAMYKIGG